MLLSFRAALSHTKMCTEALLADLLYLQNQSNFSRRHMNTLKTIYLEIYLEIYLDISREPRCEGENS